MSSSVLAAETKCHKLGKLNNKPILLIALKISKFIMVSAGTCHALKAVFSLVTLIAEGAKDLYDSILRILILFIPPSQPNYFSQTVLPHIGSKELRENFVGAHVAQTKIYYKF